MPFLFAGKGLRGARRLPPPRFTPHPIRSTLSPMESHDNFQPFPAARFIKEIGRGKKGARSLSRDDARELYAAMLDGRVSDLELGGIMLAMRFKGESVEAYRQTVGDLRAAAERGRVGSN